MDEGGKWARGRWAKDTVIFVKTLTDETITVSVCLDVPVSFTREQIKLRGLSAEARVGSFRITFAGKQLGDDLTLRDYGVQRCSTLHLLMAIKGGSPSMNFITFARGWDSWYESQEKFQVANAALDAQAQWAKGGMTAKALRDACAGEGYGRDEQEITRQAGGYALAMGAMPLLLDGDSTYVPLIPGARFGDLHANPANPAHVPQTMTQQSGGGGTNELELVRMKLELVKAERELVLAKAGGGGIA